MLGCFVDVSGGTGIHALIGFWSSVVVFTNTHFLQLGMSWVCPEELSVGSLVLSLVMLGSDRHLKRWNSIHRDWLAGHCPGKKIVAVKTIGSDKRTNMAPVSFPVYPLLLSHTSILWSSRHVIHQSQLHDVQAYSLKSCRLKTTFSTLPALSSSLY